jgi:hypothetical protein
MRKLAILFLCLTASAGQASAQQMLLAGASRGANSDYGFAGAIVPVFGASVGRGPALRLWTDYLDYTYTGGVGPVSAKGWGGALGAVYQSSGDWGWSNLSAGVSFRDTKSSIFDPGNDQLGSHSYLNLEGDGGYNLDSHWRARGFLSLTPSINGYIFQTGVDRDISAWVRLGANLVLQGDKNYHQLSSGVTAYFQLTPSMEIDPAIGLSHGQGKNTLYGGITLVLAQTGP